MERRSPEISVNAPHLLGSVFALRQCVWTIDALKKIYAKILRFIKTTEDLIYKRSIEYHGRSAWSRIRQYPDVPNPLKETQNLGLGPLRFPLPLGLPRTPPYILVVYVYVKCPVDGLPEEVTFRSV